MPTPFGQFFRAHARLIVLLLVLAFGLRLFFIFVVPPSNSAAGDPRYSMTAVNILSGHGISMGASPPYRPSIACVPLYPLFLAAVSAIFGPSPAAVKVTQAVIDLLTCLLLAYTAFQLVPAAYKNSAALFALALYGLFSWFTLVWTTCLLTETLVLFFTTLTVALCSLALRQPGGWRYWVGAGLSCGLAILTRPDSGLLLCAVLLFLVLRFALRRSRADVIGILGFGLAVILTLMPWTLRNYLALGVFQPLASEYGFAQGHDKMPLGYLLWLRTWIKDETYFSLVFEPVFLPTRGVFYDASRLPSEAFASEDERRHVSELLSRYNRARFFTPALDEEFRSLASERIRREPLRFFVTLPLYRAASMWLTGFSTSRPDTYMLTFRIISVMPILLGGIWGFLWWGRRHPLGWLMLLIPLTRTAFMAYHYAPETRYIVEAYPSMISFCGVAAAIVWHRLPVAGALTVLRERMPLPRKSHYLP